MLEPELPANEDQRLQTLRNLQILDTPVEESFERITRLAKRMFNVPIVTISLVDQGRQWFKSTQGVDVCETDRKISFCGHAILQNDIFLIKNALEDERFADNPLVVNPPFVRFYAGCPIRAANGLALGMFCVIDTVPHEDFSDSEKEDLKDLASMVETEINKHTYSNAQQRLVNELDQAQRSSMIDPLTRLWNRNGIESILDYHLSQSVSEKQPFGIAMVDIDYFKKVNDQYGHNIGDKVLRQIGLELLKYCRDEDAIGRWGGEEFVMLINNTEEMELFNIAERMRQTIAACCINTDDSANPSVQVTATVGLAYFTPSEQIDNVSKESLIKMADDALYRGKENGRDQVAK
ncbi:MAG: sensor domain-containing diguanylate cyclase [Gammaproteobacteria bacterium]|nr:sensor domain-containing diguanylate cyclase [Gammaproteobacteria bacterium]